MIWENLYTLDVLESTMETALFIYKLFRTQMDLEKLQGVPKKMSDSDFLVIAASAV